MKFAPINCRNLPAISYNVDSGQFVGIDTRFVRLLEAAYPSVRIAYAIALACT